MIDGKYIERLRSEISSFDPGGENRYFVFGSAARKDRFGDVDIGVIGNARTHKPLEDLRERFEESTFPYMVDIVDFDSASRDFSSYVREKEPLVWLN